MSIAGHLPAHHPLSTRTAFKGLRPLGRGLVDYEPATLWEIDTATLPPPLRRLRREARDFARSVIRPHALAEDLEHGPGRDAVLAAAARAGYLSDLVPWPLGSARVSTYTRPFHFGICLKMEEFTAACGGLGLMLGAHGLGAAPIMLSGDLDAMRRHLLPVVRENRAGRPSIFAYAITEPSAGSDVEEGEGASRRGRPGMVARRVTGGWKLDGRKVFISGGEIADSVTVFAALEGEGMASWTCFVVRKGSPGFSVPRTELKLGQRASGAAELLLEDVFVPDENVVGGLRNGWAINRAVLNYSRIPVGAIALGIARGAMEHAVDWARATPLGGKRVIDHQEAQLAIAQMAMDTWAMRSMVWRAASEWTARQAVAAATKAFCGDTAVRVCETAMELMGDHGLLHAGGAEKAYRDARLTQIYEGTNQINRLAVIEDQMEELSRVPGVRLSTVQEASA